MMRLLFFSFTLLFFACGEPSPQKPQPKIIDRTALLDELESLEAMLKDDKSTKIDKSLANAMIENSLKFVEAFPKDSLSGAYLFRAADISVGIGEYQQAIDYWEQMQTQYQSHEKAPIALFFQGFTCENHLNDKAKATAYYQAFLSKYSEHEYAGQVKLLLEQMNKSEEELIKEFQKRRESNG